MDAATHLTLTLPASKTDPFRKGVTVYIAAAPGQPSCPVAAMQKLFQNYPRPPNAPLFETAPDCPLTRATFISYIRNALSQAGYNCSQFAGHSFRRGGASAAAHAGYSDYEIQLLGRWRSDAYKLYIESDTRRLLQLSSLLHWVPSSDMPSQSSGLPARQ